MHVLEFSRQGMYRMLQENKQISAIAFESYAKLINLLIYETHIKNTIIPLSNFAHSLILSLKSTNGHYISLFIH